MSFKVNMENTPLHSLLYGSNMSSISALLISFFTLIDLKRRLERLIIQSTYSNQNVSALQS